MTANPDPAALSGVQHMTPSEFAKREVGDILAAAWSFDDKPHQLFSAVRRMVEAYEDDPEVRDKAVRLMDRAYSEIGKAHAVWSDEMSTPSPQPEPPAPPPGGPYTSNTDAVEFDDLTNELRRWQTAGAESFFATEASVVPPPGEMPLLCKHVIEQSDAAMKRAVFSDADSTILWLNSERERLVQALAEANKRATEQQRFYENTLAKLHSTEDGFTALRDQLSTLQEAAAQKDAVIAEMHRHRACLLGVKRGDFIFAASDDDIANVATRLYIMGGVLMPVDSSSPGATSRDDQ